MAMIRDDLREGYLKNINIKKGTLNLIYSWLFLAILSLVLAGLFAFLIALARTPVIKDFLPGKDYFYTALVIHVDLAFVIWFLAFMGVLWTVSSTIILRADINSKTPGWLGFFASATGTLFLIIPAISGQSKPLLSNYVPVLTHPFFYAGLILFASGILITIINTFLTVRNAIKIKSFPRPFPLISYGMVLAGITVFIAFLCFLLAYIFLNRSPLINPLEGAFFERLFWGGGHILQFSNTIGMVTAWIFLAYLILGTALPVSDRIAKFFFGIFILFVIPAPVLFFTNDITDQVYKEGFTALMQFGFGLSTGLYAMAILFIIWRVGSKNDSAFKIRILPWDEPGFSSLVFSIILFGLGGGLGLMIRGSNVKVPSHYHGVIGGITIAFMGLTYYILPLLKKKIYSLKMARVQPYLYGIGQTMFVLGMFWAGTYGMSRKTFGQAEVLRSYTEYVSMTIMGLGGFIAVLGGGMYVINILLSLLSPSRKGDGFIY